MSKLHVQEQILLYDSFQGVIHKGVGDVTGTSPRLDVTRAI